MLGINTKTNKSLDNTVVLTSMKKINENTILNVSEPNTLKMSNNEPHNFLDSENIEDVANDTDKKKGIFSDLKEKWKNLDPAKKAGVVGAILGAVLTFSPLILVLATLTLPTLILGGILYGAVKGAQSKVVTTAVDKTADGIRKTGEYIKSNVNSMADKTADSIRKTGKSIKSNVKNTADKTADSIRKTGKSIKSNVKSMASQCNLTKEFPNAEKFIQDINSKISELLAESNYELTTEGRNNIEKLTFQKEIAEMIQDKSVVKAMKELADKGEITGISSKDIKRCVEKGKSTFDKDKADLTALIEKISTAAQKSFSKTDEFKKEVEKVQKENSPNTKLEINTKSVEQVNDNNIEK